MRFTHFLKVLGIRPGQEMGRIDSVGLLFGLFLATHKYFR